MAEYTRESYDALRVALDEAKVKHAEAQRQIGIVTDGDTNVWHDNFAFEEANRQELMLRGRVAHMSRLIAEAVVVEKTSPHDHVQVGSHVVVKFDDDEETFVIGGEQNYVRRSSDGHALLSPKSPLGSALMKKAIGESISYELPNGTVQQATIVKVW